MDRPSPELVDCPHCGAKNPVINDQCSSCSQLLSIYIGPRPRVRTLHLREIMVAIAVFALCLATMRAVPCLGIGVSFFALPVLLRTMLAVAERKMDGRPMTFREIHAQSWESLGIVLIIYTAMVVVALVLIGVVDGLVSTTNPLWTPLMVGSALTSVGLAGSLARKLWPRSD